jgi:hypothetical protein
MDAYVIVGDANTRKSSVLRSLTGCFNRSIRDIILLNETAIKIYARVSSLQDSKTEPRDFITEVQKTGQKNVIFCLWPHANPNDSVLYPDASEYIATFVKVDWRFQASAVLGSSTFRPATQRSAHFTESLIKPINLTAQAVCQHFWWQ